ncbi:acyl-CoA dehydrogenase family protein [Microbacterium trichothecenolyticum]|uniref:Alkylation response protein AidB-like acyl-CoA dehydrogenase n=1 Tax=Microbacterium trichothecenolyticum TaxID=69370 RepID=A0ABU0TZ38_MICTR|nr:acyl-CoA dehydrogenase family protein [Microbacterium trichothecenolyticum]MDQ1124926.1 alkylation response protein AidB-like acyl-CoA dehydrogenase [Microbacterium trichothecenolyticum]
MSHTADLIQRFAPVFDEVGADAIAREKERRLPYAEIETLRASGFTRVTLPVELGGDGADHLALFELLAELARRDPNLAQLFRSHFSVIDRALHAPRSEFSSALLRRLSEGAIHGNASFERGSARVGSYSTVLTRDDCGLRLDGRKFYSTGTLFADIVSVLAAPDARSGVPGETVGVLVSTNAPGLTRIDDWDGFGQRLTGSGSTVFEGVRVNESDLVSRSPEPSHAGAFVQLVLLATLTGIGRAVVDDATRYVGERTRSYSHASAARPKDDPLVQEVIGDLSAASFCADAALAAAVTVLDRVAAPLRETDGGRPTAPDHDPAAAHLATARAQLVIIPAILRATTELFEVGGATAVGADLAWDRHWRNARTIASHNPARYKARSVGDHLVNGTPVVSWWTSGEA